MPPRHPRSPETGAATRRTKRQRALLALLARDDRFRSAQQLHTELRAESALSIGLTSVYRILHRLTAEQVVETQRAEDGEFLYRLRHDTRHHHNLLCRICGRAEQFAIDELEHHTERIAHRHRYVDLEHHIDLYGTCPDCAAGIAQPPG
ncbi:Fur family transcriptional regulator [Nocardia pseudobrasiliensis]|uniref:Fur family transcriptional regulator n=1 Tax=Nocardia pseudobrasiliensis TaxID=45979 RepID=UPI0009EE2172|nr:transcriptional repressor [Nocardia pseudobrasiliensis]